MEKTHIERELADQTLLPEEVVKILETSYADYLEKLNLPSEHKQKLKENSEAIKHRILYALLMDSPKALEYLGQL